MKTNLTSIFARTALAASLLSISSTQTFAQQGDSKDTQPQTDPIPASDIPPSPLLSTEDAIKSMELADGFKIQAIADESLNQPVCLAFDADGRAWVVEMTQYMVDFEATDENKPNGVIKVLEDTTGDGNLDKVTVFKDDLILPRACAVTKDGLLYVSNDQLLFIKRGGKDGTTPIGEPEVMDAEYAVGGNAEHKPNGLLFARDNWYYSAKAKFRYRKINGKWHKQETDFRGQWGIAQDDAGRLFYNTNSTILISDQTRPNLFRKNPKFTPKHSTSFKVGSNDVFPIRITPGINRAYRKNNLSKEGKITSCTAASGMTIYRGDQFPAEFQNVAFVTEPGPQLIKAIKVERNEINKAVGSFVYKEKEFLASTDEWFRPVNAYTAPDGTLWFIDMAHGLIQHKAYMTTYLRRQSVSRNLQHKAKNNGRIYRVSYEKNKINKTPKLSKASIQELYEYLNHANGTVRDTAQRLLVEHITTDEKKLAEWKNIAIPVSDSNTNQQLCALWVYEATGSIPEALILNRLQSKNTDIVNSALELAHLANSEAVHKAVINLKTTLPTAQSSLFALAQIATEDSNGKAQTIVKKYKDVGETKSLYIGALGDNLTKVAGFKNTTDSGLKNRLAEALKKNTAKVTKAPKIPKAFKASAERGKSLYLGKAACSACHGVSGEGQGDILPPLAPSDWVNTDNSIMTKVILRGLAGAIHVNGKKYDNGQFMPQRPDLTDQEIADLMVYIKHLKGNKGGVITAEEVAKTREETKDRTEAYTEADLMPKK